MSYAVVASNIRLGIEKDRTKFSLLPLHFSFHHEASLFRSDVTYFRGSGKEAYLAIPGHQYEIN
jgi:trehalose utilization protein|tara:strand:- start:4600 stop:4791 length:192 start_codon:yes stop_codon:yes gene_type:complete